MIKRTTIEVDQDLLMRAKRAIGAKTARATVDEALRRLANTASTAQADRTARQRIYLAQLGSRIDASVLTSGEMWG
ncbi:MAG TPA: type II toxin-antitoxin system VapB family antitoxin [Candidatus Dormibacteraeota bacterium]|nr:type II toxin-antitoxin system VapB family antitoxin [Candidatus Dormibacteraeota bacterium]